jgi:threonine dehydrogenase-like Zn-dependent dehydrogenase
LLVAHGVEVFAVDMVPHRLEFAQKFGAIPLSATEGDLAVTVRDLTQGRCADHVIELTGADGSTPCLWSRMYFPRGARPRRTS